LACPESRSGMHLEWKFPKTGTPRLCSSALRTRMDAFRGDSGVGLHWQAPLEPTLNRKSPTIGRCLNVTSNCRVPNRPHPKPGYGVTARCIVGSCQGHSCSWVGPSNGDNRTRRRRTLASRAFARAALSTVARTGAALCASESASGTHHPRAHDDHVRLLDFENVNVSVFGDPRRSLSQVQVRPNTAQLLHSWLTMHTRHQ
jgi:hypothetical protein